MLRDFHGWDCPVMLLGSALHFSKLFGSCSHCSPEPSCQIGGVWMAAGCHLWHECLVTLLWRNQRAWTWGMKLGKI